MLSMPLAGPLYLRGKQKGLKWPWIVSLHKIGINGNLKSTWGVDRIDHTDSKFVQTGETPVLLAIFMSKGFDRRFIS
ncbi:MAG TPA: hypothetical protein DEF42_02855 [Desulfosporosinus sp.]|nr:hypothetical protein [Desulfosporosinus sp.]